MGSSGTRDWTCDSCIVRQILHHGATREASLNESLSSFQNFFYYQIIFLLPNNNCTCYKYWHVHAISIGMYTLYMTFCPIHNHTPSVGYGIELLDVRIWTFQIVTHSITSFSRSFSSVQSLSHVRLFATPWTAACQASMSITNFWSLIDLQSQSVKKLPFHFFQSYMWKGFLIISMYLVLISNYFEYLIKSIGCIDFYLIALCFYWS